MTNLRAFPWYGGKNSHLKFLLPLLPTDAYSYVEPFGGSAAVLLNRPPAKLETLNDLNQEIVNFFRVLRERPDELIDLLRLTPHSRAEYEQSKQPYCGSDVLERARLFYVSVQQSFGSKRDGGWKATNGSRNHNMPATLVNSSNELLRLVDRLMAVQLECRPATDVIKRYDGSDVLMYVDPPYVPDSRRAINVYDYEMSRRDHVELAELLNQCEARICLSGYRCDLYDDLYNGWTTRDWTTNARTPGDRSTRKETVWMNYEPPQQDLFEATTR